MDEDSTVVAQNLTEARFVEDAAAKVRPGHLGSSRNSGDAWVEGDAGKFWGTFGSAGLLVFDAARGVLLQHRAIWSHHGGTWGLPGGALHKGESAVDGALRESWEEAGVPRESVELLFTSVYDVGYWRYTTVVVNAVVPFQAVISDPESLALEWVEPSEVAQRPLHPGFGKAWPELRARLAELT
ncbi:NUDIX domain-containing protein [Arthrobacter alpinus]|uniref:NUDIX domain-containing protein n=1 Tax=Arthrobacter alpinus TaxID=656366 RepID=UPI0009E88CBA|nr:NUDIX hydrolase [Arthrobacter alpinus]